MEGCTQAFAILKPVCDKIVHAPSKENVTELIELLRQSRIPSMVLQELQEYILFPLDLHLKNTATKQETRRYLVDGIKEVLCQTNMISLVRLYNLYSLLFCQIFDKNSTGLVANVSEELKCSVTECASMLVRKASSQALYGLYNKKNVPKLSQGIYICVHLAHAEKARSVRLAAIEFIATLAQVHDAECPSDVMLRKLLGDFLMFVLPGIVGGLSKAMVADAKQGHKVTMMALRAWSRIVAIVLEDGESTNIVAQNNINFKLQQQSTPTDEDPNPLPAIWKNKDREGMLDYLESQCRSPSWIKSTAEKLALLADKLVELQTNPHRLVRNELVRSCDLLLSRCSTNFQPAVIQLLEILIMLSEDEVSNVADSSKDAIARFTRKCESDNSKSLLEILEENFFSLVTKVPRILNSTNDVEQLSALRLLAGYLRTLGPSKLPEVLISSIHLQRLVMTLIHVVQLDNSGVSLLEDCSLRDLNSSQIAGLNGPWKQFHHFTDRVILKKTEEICQLLGQLGDIAILSDHFLDLFHNSPLHRKEIVLLLNEILCAKQTEEKSEHTLHIIKNVLEVYLEPSTWYIPLTVDSESGLTINQGHSNLILACLLVEGLGKMAATFGRAYDRFLLRTLYPILERAGSSHGLLAAAGMTAVERLAEAGGHESVTKLICANVDYFSYHVTMKLRRYEQNTGVLDVLNVVMKHSTIDVLPCIREIVSDILLQSCDTFQDASASAFLQVFHTFVKCVRHWLVPSADLDSFSQEPTKPKPRDYDKELKDYREAKARVNSFLNSGEEEMNDELTEDIPNEVDETMDVDEDGNAKKKVPGHIQMTVSVLRRCLHFLPSNNKQQKLIVLETLQEGIKILANWEDQLLPVVHQIWSPLVGRFKEDALVVNRSFALLCTLTCTSKDFIRARTIKDVLPSLYTFLDTKSSNSYKKDSGSAYRFTQEYKLQFELLDRLGALAVDLALQEKELDDMMMAALPYVSHFQPVPLQNCCVKLFKHLATYDVGCVWVKAYSMTQPNSDNKTYEDLQKNANVILRYCNDFYVDV